MYYLQPLPTARCDAALDGLPRIAEDSFSTPHFFSKPILYGGGGGGALLLHIALVYVCNSLSAHGDGPYFTSIIYYLYTYSIVK